MQLPTSLVVILTCCLGWATSSAEELKFESALMPESLKFSLSSDIAIIKVSDLSEKDIEIMRKANAWPPIHKQWTRPRISLKIPELGFEWERLTVSNPSPGGGFIPFGLFVSEDRKGVAIGFAEYSIGKLLYFTQSDGKWAVSREVEFMQRGGQYVQHFAFLPMTEELAKVFGIKGGESSAVASITISPLRLEDSPEQSTWLLEPDRIEKVFKQK